MYAVIEFSPQQGGGLSLVSKKWLTPRKKEVFWPPYKEQAQFTRSLKRSEEINCETWRLYNVHRIFFESDDYDEAILKLKRAEETSDLATTTEDDEAPMKRKRSAPSRFLESSEEEEETSYIRPPPVKRSLFKGENHSIRNAHTSSLVTVASKDVTIHNDNSMIASSSKGKCDPSYENSGFQKEVLTHLMNIREQNNQILNLLIQKTYSSTKLPEDFPVQFPIQSLDQLNTLEEFLNKAENLNSLALYLSGFGGKDIINSTNRILKTILTDALAKEFSFYGMRQQKRKFAELHLKSAIIRAIKRNNENTLDSNVEDIIKVWLKHASQRLQRRKS